MSFNLHNGVYNFTTSCSDGSLSKKELLGLLKCEKEYLKMKYGIDTRKMIVPNQDLNNEGILLDITNLAEEALFDNNINLLDYNIPCDAVMINRFAPSIALAYPTSDNPVITIESDYAIALASMNIDKLNDNLLEDIVKKFLRVCNLSNDKIKIHVGPCCSYESNNIKDIVSSSLDRIGVNNVEYDNRDTVTNDDLFSEIGNKKGNHLTGIYYKPDEKTLKLLRHHSKWY